MVNLGGMPESRWKALRLAIAALALQIGVGLEGAAPIWFHHDLLPPDQLPHLYAAATHYISLCRGAGWDQRALEAAASGLALIVPNHSAYATCFDPPAANLIDSYKMPCVTAEAISMGSAYAGLHWWEPDEHQASAFIRAAIDGNPMVNAAARTLVLERYTWEQAARRLLMLLRCG